MTGTGARTRPTGGPIHASRRASTPRWGMRAPWSTSAPVLPPGAEGRMVARLADALRSGAWDAEHGHLRSQREFDGALRLVVSEPA
jgi:hypothetical protein